MYKNIVIKLHVHMRIATCTCTYENNVIKLYVHMRVVLLNYTYI